MDIDTNNLLAKNELLDIMRLFYEGESTDKVIVRSRIKRRKFVNKVYLFDKKFIFKHRVEKNIFKDKLLKDRYNKRLAKAALYDALSSYFNVSKPWGNLTGIRPTKLYYQLKNDEGVADAYSYFKNVFKVSDKKMQLLKNVIDAQTFCYNTNNKMVDIYVGIPFCKSRCSYCSFISAEIDKSTSLVEPYLDSLKSELLVLGNIINDSNLKVRSVYVGGGTPTSISAKQLEGVLKLLDFGASEFTVECGRPDTINKEKLQVIKDCGAGRISVNPQTFNQRTLNIIGRKHLVSETESVYDLAKPMGFVINMDLIAGLEGEEYDDFKTSVNRAIALSPDNITVHTICLKKGAELKNRVKYINDDGVSAMVEYAYEMLLQSGYNPYYMYRQKYMAGHNENVGYAKGNTQCIYNIDTMEENTSILAFGANSISKVVLPRGRIERQANAKDISSYIAGVDKQKNAKINLFSLLKNN